MEQMRVLPKPRRLAFSHPTKSPWMLRLISALEVENPKEPLTMQTFMEYSPQTTPWGDFPMSTQMGAVKRMRKDFLGAIHSLRSSGCIVSVGGTSPRSYAITNEGRRRVRNGWGNEARAELDSIR